VLSIRVSELERVKADPLSSPETARRLGKNINGYFGETIDLASVLRDCTEAAKAHGWSVTEIPVNETLSLPAFTRADSIAGGDSPPIARPRVYISAGIHGDEPAGPLAMRRLLQENKWPTGFGFWLLPCLNPTGFLSNRRENAHGLDLNRQYLEPQAPETAAHIRWLGQQPSFDLCLCLHEDWEAHGFYVYELNSDNRPSLAEAMVARVAGVCPVDQSELIEGRTAKHGIIRPNVDPRDRPQWPEAFYLLTHKTRLSYTLEAPSDFPLGTRVAALFAGVNAALELLDQQSRRETVKG
jgi:protein MpaA